MKRVLFLRYDKIGDFTLSWPALSLLKKAMPEASIEVLVSPVTKAFALACPYVDHVIIDDGDDQGISERIKEREYDGAIVSLSEFRGYKFLKPSQIPFVLAPKHNWYQYLYKHRADHQYKKGEGCWRGACMLVESFLAQNGYDIPEVTRPLWNVQQQKPKWQQYYHQQNDEKLIFAHPGTGGSSGGVPVDSFARMLIDIDKQTKLNCRFVLTYSGEEERLAQQMHDLLVASNIKVAMAKPLSSLAEFAESLVAADMFIAGSTGPLHLAGLHNVPTVGFYAGRRSAPEVRWQSLSADARRLAFTPPIGKKTGRNMALVNFDIAAAETAQFLNTFYADDISE